MGREPRRSSSRRGAGTFAEATGARARRRQLAVRVPSVANDPGLAALEAWLGKGPAERRHAQRRGERSRRMAFDIDVREIVPSGPRADADRPRRATIEVCHVENGAVACSRTMRGVALRGAAGRRPSAVVRSRIATLAEISELLTGSREPASDPIGCWPTVLFTDVVGSTDRRGSAGRPTLARPARDPPRCSSGPSSSRYRGREIDTAGDGFLAVFDGPGPGDPRRRSRSAEAVAGAGARASGRACTPARSSS